MAAIFGIWRLDGRSIEPGELDRMGDRLLSRGPDSCGVWSDGPIALGHRALYTGPDSPGATQPVVDDQAGLVLTAEARLDNRDELIEGLGFRSHERNDAALLLATYARWGQACVERLVGDFAFAIWDRRRGALFCARDHFGVRPLYYCHRPGRLFAFASEVAALLSLDDVEDDVDELEVARHLLVPVGTDPAATYYRSVRRALPAHALVVSGTDVETRPYWDLDPKAELTLASDQAYSEALRASFLEAVRCRIRGADPLASMLSGGIDSSAVTCAAAILRREAGDPPLHTLSAVYPNAPRSDEREYIDAVLERHEAVTHFFEADAVSPIAEIDAMNRFVGGANWGATLYISWALYGIAAQAGCRVVLNGFDGDATLSMGGGYLPELALAGRWLKLARETTAYARRLGHPVARSNLAMLRMGLRLRMGRGGGWRNARRLMTFRRSPSGGDGSGAEPVTNPDFEERVGSRIESPPEPPRTERETHRRLLLGQALQEGLGWNEACAGGRSVEARFPFFDVRLVELCLSFPPDQKLRRGWTRYAMRGAMEGILPPKIQWRPGKANLHPGWLVAYREGGHERVSALLESDDAELASYLNLKRLRSLHERLLTGRIDLSEERAMWRGVSLALWLDGRGERAIHGDQPRRSNSMSPRSRSSSQ